MLKNGNECFCVEEVPFVDLFLTQDEDNNCNVTCTGSELYNCGGSAFYSIYVASKSKSRIDFYKMASVLLYRSQLSILLTRAGMSLFTTQCWAVAQDSLS